MNHSFFLIIVKNFYPYNHLLFSSPPSVTCQYAPDTGKNPIIKYHFIFFRNESCRSFPIANRNPYNACAHLFNIVFVRDRGVYTKKEQLIKALSHASKNLPYSYPCCKGDSVYSRFSTAQTVSTPFLTVNRTFFPANATPYTRSASL